MARATGPLMSMDASGSLSKTLVFAKWKGRNYVRAHVVPANPRTTAQIAIRALMTMLTRLWFSLHPSTIVDADWQSLASDGKYSIWNAFVHFSMKRLRQGLGVAKDPGAINGTTCANATAATVTAGAGSLDAVYTASTSANSMATLLLAHDGTLANYDVMSVVAGGYAQNQSLAAINLAPGSYDTYLCTMSDTGYVSALLSTGNKTVS